MVLLKTAEHNLPGYEPVATCGEWLVALMNDSPQYAAGEIRTMQKHTLTDEVFVLLSGQCTLFVAEGGDKPEAIRAGTMKPGITYTVLKNVWHTHSLCKGTKVLVVENSDTDRSNSPIEFLDEEQWRWIKENSC